MSLSNPTKVAKELSDIEFSESNRRYPIPVLERVLEMCVMGHSQDDIFYAVKSEFEDILFSPISKSNIKTIISDNMEVVRTRRKRIAELCREQTEEDMLDLFNICRPSEELMVKTYNNKLVEAMDELGSLSLSEKDDDGNFKNTQRIMNLMAMAEKFHATISKVSGLDAVREVEIFRQKSNISSAAKNGSGLLPDATPQKRPASSPASDKIIDMPSMD